MALLPKGFILYLLQLPNTLINYHTTLSDSLILHKSFVVTLLFNRVHLSCKLTTTNLIN